jgi:hypothetical protein
MIQRLIQDFARLASRRARAVLLVALLNLALVPCTMALEVVEKGHDCCPPELQLELPQCCEIDDVSIDKRDGTLEPWDHPDLDDSATGSLDELLARVPARDFSAANPPDPPDRVEARHKLFCVYLN